MATLPTVLPDRTAELRLYERLLAGERTASSDLATTYLDALIQHLTQHNARSIDPALIEEAAGTAILSLIGNPASYHPDRLRLFAFLCMSALGDLRNLLQREQKHRAGRKSWQDVEQSPVARKYLLSMDDPTAALEANEERQQQLAALPVTREGLSATEVAVWSLIVAGERRTARYAEAMQITHLPPADQRKEVKRFKDRLKVRRKRAGGEP